MIGQQAEIDFNYFIMPHTLMRVVYQHFFPGWFLKETPPGQDVNYVTVWFDYHFNERGQMTEKLTHPIVKAAIDALQAGDSEAWKELFDPDAVPLDDGCCF
jgi:hypothetical protein